ncbi:MAG: hypothetical protein E6Q97_00930 [Desulfurellales bacterium]|nr:MAG: hypothetical protein E6Q97_00930 [Desulfurellales bacterium]
MIDLKKAAEHWPDVLGALPKVELERGEDEVTHLFRNLQLVLSMQGFSLERIDNEFRLTHKNEELVRAPSHGDMILMLCIAGALGNLKGAK